MRNKDGSEDYEPDSLRVMIAALDQQLKEHGHKQCIIRDREFFTSKQVLEGKARPLREEEKGKRQNKSRSLSKEEEEVPWEIGKLGSSIVKVTGHRILQSLDHYDEENEAEQRDISTKISRRNNLQISNPSFNIDGQQLSSTTFHNNLLVFLYREY